MPFPTTKVIHPRWSGHHQPVAQGGMTGSCIITGPGAAEPVWDDVAKEYTLGDDATVYAGVCRVQADFRPTKVDQSGQETAGRRYLVAITADAAGPFDTGTVVTITAAPNDALLVGRTLYVVDTWQATERFERDLLCADTFDQGQPAT